MWMRVQTSENQVDVYVRPTCWNLQELFVGCSRIQSSQTQAQIHSNTPLSVYYNKTHNNKKTVQ